MSDRIKRNTSKIYKELSNTIDSLNNLELERFMKPHLDALTASLELEEIIKFTLKIIYYGFEDRSTIINTYKDLEETILSKVNIEEKSWEEVSIDSDNTSKPLALFIFIADKGQTIEGLFDHLSIISARIPFVKIYSNISWKANPRVKKRISVACGKLELASLDIDHPLSLSADLTPLISTRNKKLLRLSSNIFQLKEVQNLFEQRAHQINFSITSKKQQQEQRITKLQHGEVNGYGDTQEIKRRINNRIKQFEKQYKEYQKEHFSVPIGIFFSKEETKINQLNYLDAKPAGKQIIYTIPENVLENIILSIKQETAASLNKEADKALAFATSLENEIAHFLDKKGGTLLTKTNIFIDESRVNQLVDSTLVFDKNFEERATDRSGFYNFFMNARRYYMIIFMIVPMLGIGISTIIDGLGYYMIPISIFIFGFGGLSEWNNQQKEKEEDKRKNLNKARTYLNDQVKRILDNLSKRWKEEVVDNLKDQAERILSFSEKNLQEQQLSNKKTVEKDKKKEQDILSQLKDQESAFSRIDRNISRLNSDYIALKAEISERLASISEKKERDNESRNRLRNY